MNSKLSLILLLAISALAGCGGGGSSGSAGATTSTAAKVSITTSNQSTITNAAVKSATQNLTSGYLTTVGGVQTSTTPTNERVLSQWTDFAFKKMAEHQSSPPTVAGAVTTSACDSGNISFDTDGSGTAAPTYFTISFNNCVLGTTTANGTLALSNLAITYNTATPKAATSISATFTFNLTASNASTSVGMYGGFNIAATGIGSVSRTDSISGTSFNVKVGSKYETLSNFAFTSSYNDSGLTHGYSDTVDYSFASDVILAGFDFHTIMPLVRNYLDSYPRSGQVEITGANSTKLKVTVVSGSFSAGSSSGTVELQLSQDGGLTYGAAVIKTWAQLALGQ